MIDVREITKRYGEQWAVRGVSFSAGKGDIIGFLGPNGAGKTTTIRILATYLPPTSGTALVAGFDVRKQADEVRRRIGYLPENPPLYGEMTVEEYLYFVARIKKVPRKLVKQRVEESLERCFLTGVRRKLCQHLSRGFRQRAGLAQAIIHDPAVVILDEPTSGLDPKQITEIRQLIKSLGTDRTVILSTHILPEVSMVCNKVVIVSQGRVVRSGTLEELVQSESLEQLFLRCVTQETVQDSGELAA